MTLDAAVKWDPHVDAIAKKVVQKIGGLWRSRRCLCLSSRIQQWQHVRSVIMPDLAFSSSLKVSQLDRLQVLQNRAARAVYGLPPHTSAQPLLERMSLYRVRECYAQKRLVLVWRCVNGKASSDLQDLLFPGASLSPRHSQIPADLAWAFRQPWPTSGLTRHRRILPAENLAEFGTFSGKFHACLVCG